MKLIRGIAAFGLLTFLGSAYSAPVSHTIQRKAAIKVSLTESYHRDTVTRSGETPSGSYTESGSSADGRLQFSAEIPLNPGDMQKFDSTSLFSLTVGGFSFRGALADDPNYITGKNNARLALTVPTRTGAVQQVLATAQLRWEKDRLFIKVEGRTPSVKSIAASDFLEHSEGVLNAETKAEIRLGCRSVLVNMPFQVKVKRKTNASAGVLSEVVNVEVKGETKTEVEFTVVSNINS